MALNGKYMARAREQIAQQRAENEREHRRRVDDAYRRVPGLRALDQTLQQQMITSASCSTTLPPSAQTSSPWSMTGSPPGSTPTRSTCTSRARSATRRTATACAASSSNPVIT